MQHESHEIKQLSSTEEICPNPVSNTKKYVKITEEIKQHFLKYIIEDNMSIKNASEQLRINYSSAKAILSNHKKTVRKTVKSISQTTSDIASTQSSYRMIDAKLEVNPDFSKSEIPETKHTTLIVCTVGGKNHHRSILQTKTKIIFKPSIIVSPPSVAKQQRRQCQI